MDENKFYRKIYKLIKKEKCTVLYKAFNCDGYEIKTIIASPFNYDPHKKGAADVWNDKMQEAKELAKADDYYELVENKDDICYIGVLKFLDSDDKEVKMKWFPEEMYSTFIKFIKENLSK